MNAESISTAGNARRSALPATSLSMSRMRCVDWKAGMAIRLVSRHGRTPARWRWWAKRSAWRPWKRRSMRFRSSNAAASMTACRPRTGALVFSTTRTTGDPTLFGTFFLGRSGYSEIRMKPVVVSRRSEFVGRTSHGACGKPQPPQQCSSDQQSNGPNAPVSGMLSIGQEKYTRFSATFGRAARSLILPNILVFGAGRKFGNILIAI